MKLSKREKGSDSTTARAQVSAAKSAHLSAQLPGFQELLCVVVLLWQLKLPAVGVLELPALLMPHALSSALAGHFQRYLRFIETAPKYTIMEQWLCFGEGKRLFSPAIITGSLHY